MQRSATNAVDNTMLNLALSYAAQGWPVFPVRSTESADPQTGEIMPEKSPLTARGFRDATTTTRIINARWNTHPDAAIGIPTGEKIGAWVLDLDVKQNANGHEWLAAMEDLHGALPYSARVRTANGGTHIYFNHCDGVRNRGKLGAGVDVRGEGGFVLAPGSILDGGREYVWLDDTGPDDIVDAPAWLLDLVLPPKYEDAPGQGYTYTQGTNDRYVMRAVEAELHALACMPPGNRNNELNDAAFALGQFVGAGALDRSYVEGELIAIASQWPNLGKSKGTIKSGLDAGIKRPRNIPEREHPTEDNTNLEAIKDMIDRALAKPVAEVPTAQPTPAAAPEPPTTKPAFHATPFDWLDPKTIPTREFAFGQHYIRKYVSVTVSPGGLGKTSNSIVEALAMVSGKPLTGVKPTAGSRPTRLNVWIFNAEDPRDEMARRIMAACVHYRLSDKDIAGRLFMDTGREQELVIMHEDRKTGLKINEPVVEAIVEQIHQHNIDVMIIDPFVSTHRVNENDNGAIDKVAKLWAQIADRTNCAIDVVHHLRKLADREATVEDARGAVSLIGAARSVRVLNRMSPDQEKQANLDEGHRFSYFWIEHGKSNLTKMDSARHWRKLESVPLNNGGDGEIDFMLGDQVGVVTAWEWPSKDEIAAGIPTDVRSLVMARMGNMNCQESTQSPDWAGYVLADAMGESIDVIRSMTPEKRRIKAVLDSWISNGILTVVPEPHPKYADRQIRYIRPV